MRWCRFQHENKTAFGILDDANIISAISGSPFENYSVNNETHALRDVKLLVPIIPPTFYAAGINYREHVVFAAKVRGVEPAFPTKPDVGYRAINALIPHEDPIVIPRDASELVQYEGELVVVVGKQSKHLSEDEAFSCILGYSIGNDVSERTWQASDDTMWRSKNTDTFKPMGPWIETDADPTSMETTVRLNGKTVSEFDTNNMVFSIATYISAMTRYLTLYPGDVIWMGTDGSTENIKAGDIVDIEISGIGTLTNTVVSEE